MKKLLIILVVIGIIGAGAAFGISKLVRAFSKAGEAADGATASFHAEYNAGHAAALFSGAAPAFQKGVKAEEWNQLIAMLHEKLGRWQSGDRNGVSLNNDGGDKTLRFTCSATFEKGAGTEEFVFDYNGDTPLLLKYKVDSPALMSPAAPPATSASP